MEERKIIRTTKIMSNDEMENRLELKGIIKISPNIASAYEVDDWYIITEEPVE